MMRIARIGLLSLLALVLHGCAIYAPQFHSEGKPFAQRFEHIPTRVDMVEVPFVPQDSFFCGPASLSMVLTHMGLDAPFEQLESELVLPARKGTLQLDMLVVARERGAVPHVLKPHLDDVIRTLAMGHPVIALENFGSFLFPLWHYSVLVGYDLQQGVLFRRSGMREVTRIPISVFEYLWADDGHWAMVALPHDVAPVTPQQGPWRDHLIQMEKRFTPRQALQAWETFGRHFPGDPLGWAGQGNALANQENWQEAAKRYERALNLAPDHVRMAKTGSDIFERAGLIAQNQCARQVMNRAAKWPC